MSFPSSPPAKKKLKYGYSNFSLEILEYCDPCSLLTRENHYIKLLKPEYNVLQIAGSRLGHKHTEESKAKIAAALLGYKHTEESKAKMRAVAKINAANIKQKVALR